MFGIEERPARLSQQGMQQIMMMRAVFMAATITSGLRAVKHPHETRNSAACAALLWSDQAGLREHVRQ
jgi:hypothetical protein